MTKKIQEMSAAQMSRREDIVNSMKKNFADFRKRYGDQAKSVMYATATKQAMDEEQETDEEEFYSEHMCAQHVYHDVYGEGVVLEGEHDVPDADGEIAWYTVEFAHGKETVYTEDVMIMAERYHGHMMKRRKMKEDVDQIDESEEEGSDYPHYKRPAKSQDYIGNRSITRKLHNLHKKHNFSGVTFFAAGLDRKGDAPAGVNVKHNSPAHDHPEFKKHLSNLVKFNEEVEQVDELSKSTLQSYAGKVIDKTRTMPQGAKKQKHLAGLSRSMEKMKNEEVEEVDEALVGNQHKIDMNKNNRIDAHDFKLLRKIKKTRNQ